MQPRRTGARELITGAGGVLMIVSLFLPWAEAGGTSLNGWELWTMADVYFLVVACVALWAAVTGGNFGFFRADMSVRGTTDILGVVATILIAWLILFDFPDGATREVGVFLALIAAMAIAGGVGQYRMPQGGWFPPTTPDGTARPG